MHRFYTEQIDLQSNKAYITGDDVKHMKKVLRLNEGETIVVCDYKNKDYICKIFCYEEGRVNLDIVEIKDNFSEPPINITIYQGLPKSDKLDYIIQKCVEIGVVKIVPVATKRSVVKINDSAKDEKKQIRWQKVADEAAKQCGRGVKVEVSNVQSFKNAVESADQNALKLLPYENEKDTSLKTILRNESEKTKKEIAIFIGPEGGFADEEIELAKKWGFNLVTLGPRILRTETAPIAAAAACMYELGDW